MAVFNHVGQAVSDPERSMRFYREVLGFRFWYQVSPDDAGVSRLSSLPPPLGVTCYYMTLGDFALELMHYSAPGAQTPYRPRTMNEPGLTHLSISVADIRETARKAVEYGGEVIEESDLGMALMLRDPDGQLVELLDEGFGASRPPRPEA